MPRALRAVAKKDVRALIGNTHGPAAAAADITAALEAARADPQLSTLATLSDSVYACLDLVL